jgi:hypothetical protein
MGKRKTMKLNKLFLAFAFSACLFACKDDDSSNDNDPTNVVLTFDRVLLREMSMWVGGEEVATGNIEIAEYMDDDVYAYFNTDDLSDGSVHFIGDSIIVDAAFLSSTAKYLYRFSDDSLYVTYPFFGETYTARGNRRALEITMGYSYKSETGTFGWNYYWNYDPYYYTFKNTYSNHGYASLSEMAENDTLLIYNQTILLN